MSSSPIRVSRLGVMAVRERLSPRDQQILEHVGMLRLLAARQIQALLFPDDSHASERTAARCCRRALERLTRQCLLVRLERRVGGVRAGSASYVYALGPLGKRVLELSGPRLRLSEPSARFVDHTLAVADFFVRLAQHVRAGGCELLRWESEPGCWREVMTLGGRVVLRPDLFVVIALGEYELRWFIEIDRGSEHLPAIRRKCRLYQTYYKSGQEQRRHGVFPRVLWITPDERRAKHLRAAIDTDRLLRSVDLFRTVTVEQALVALGDAA